MSSFNIRLMNRLKKYPIVPVLILASGSCHLVFSPVQADNSTLDRNPSLSVSTLTERGHKLYGKGLYDQAAAAYRQALQRSSNLPLQLRVAAMNNLGAALRENRQYKEAESVFKQALGLATTSSIADQDIEQVRKQYAYLLRKMKREKEAADLEYGNTPQYLNATRQTQSGQAQPARFDKTGSAKSTLPQVSSEKPASPDTSFTSAPARGTDSPDKLQALADQNPGDEKIWLALARAYQRENNQEQLITTLRHIVRQFPSNGRALRELARLLIKEKRSAEALVIMQAGYKGDPKDPKNYIAMAQLYMETGDINSVIEVLQEFILEFPNNEYAAKAKEQIAYFTKETATARADESARTYGKSQPAWSKGHMPLKVFIGARENSPTLNAEENISSLSNDSTVSLLERAFSEWQSGSSGAVSFTFVPTKNEANIICNWMNSSATMYHDSAQGMTQTSKGAHGAVKIISILLYGPDGRALNTDEFYEICLHEIGHALGLGHSNDREDIMYPSTRQIPVTSLSQRDREVLMQLYRL